ncbi:MAG: putative dynein heavy chain, partial [Streblomastix strix]
MVLTSSPTEADAERYFASLRRSAIYRCYITLTFSLHLHLGGNPAGPAGTGKTETTKDLAKALARQCVVFNCSDQIDYQMMGRFFSRLVQAGAWACFDEFNRIDIEVLSVIAQQILTILDAVKQQLTHFEFEGNVIKMNPNCGFFITMNPGYAGRTELPDNLKALFRPVAMMIPDYALIAEIMLFSQGFQTAKDLAQKMTQLYKLSSEQLSQQDHYEFDDVPLFMDIIRDLFPGVNIPPVEHAILQQSLTSVLKIQGMQPAQQFILKCLQVYETMEVRWGLMLVGETGTGKTTCLRALCNALTEIHESAMAQALDEEEIELQSTQDADKLSLTPSSQQLNATVSQNKTIKDDLLRESFGLAKTTTLNPKAVTMGELYGEFNEITREWHDGLVPYYVKEMLERQKEQANKVSSGIGLYSNVSPHIAQKHK